MKRILKKYGSNYKTERPVKSRNKPVFPINKGVVDFE